MLSLLAIASHSRLRGVNNVANTICPLTRRISSAACARNMRWGAVRMPPTCAMDILDERKVATGFIRFQAVKKGNHWALIE